MNESGSKIICCYIVALSMTIISGCGNDSSFAGESKSGRGKLRTSESARTESPAATPIEESESQIERASIDKPIIEEEQTAKPEAQKTSEPAVAPAGDPCVKAPASLNTRFSTKFDKPNKAVEISLSDVDDSISITQLSDPKRIVLKFSEQEQAEIACAEAVILNLAGGSDSVTIPGVAFDLTVNGGAGNDFLDPKN